MSEHTRYDTRIDDGTLFVEHEDGWLEVGAMADVLELLGGETYTIEYTGRQAAAAWIDPDENNEITVDLRERIAEMTFNEEFVGDIADAAPDEAGEAGHPERAERFAAKMRDILESAGAGAAGDDA